MVSGGKARRLPAIWVNRREHLLERVECTVYALGIDCNTRDAERVIAAVERLGFNLLLVPDCDFDKVIGLVVVGDLGIASESQIFGELGRIESLFVWSAYRPDGGLSLEAQLKQVAIEATRNLDKHPEWWDRTCACAFCTGVASLEGDDDDDDE